MHARVEALCGRARMTTALTWALQRQRWLLLGVLRMAWL